MKLFVKPYQHTFGTCHYDMELPFVPVVRRDVVSPDAPIYLQNKMFEDLFNTMEIKQNQVNPLNGKIIIYNVSEKVREIVGEMVKYKEIYQSVSGEYSTPIRWYHVALLYKLESDQPLIGKAARFDRYLGNGQSLSKKTTIVPIGRGPFKTWKEGAVDAINLQGLNKVVDWSVGNTLRLLEAFNGVGYRKYRNMQSPYLFSGSNHYTIGKYVSDGKFDKNAVSSQIGVALYLQEILKNGF